MHLDAFQALAASNLFSQLPHDIIKDVFDKIEYQSLLRGETLFKQGDIGDAYFILLSGRLSIVKDQPIGELLPGEGFGELALLSDQPRAASIVAVRDCELGRLDKSQFQSLVNTHPQVAVELLKVVGQWLNKQSAPVKKTPCKIITLLKMANNSAVSQMITQLVVTASSSKRTIHITPAQLTKQLDVAAKAENLAQNATVKLNQWLISLEEQNDLIFLEVEQAPSESLQYCLRQADEILYLIDATTQPSQLPEHIPQSSGLDAIEVEREVVLIHSENATRPSNTVDWISACKVTKHHHVRLQNVHDLQRLVRDLCDESIALVLGGGAARGFAHIGVIRAMQALDIPIDYICGTSMGGIIAAQYADGYSVEDLRQINFNSWVVSQPHKDFTLPISSLLSAGRAKKLTSDVFSERCIEDLWLNFFCVSTDVTDLKTHIHSSGKIWPALLASGAIPGVCSSIVSEQGNLLVDGGVLDNLPVQEMRHRHRGKIIAVNVTEMTGLEANVKDVIPPNGWRALWQYLNPFNTQKPFPHIFKLIYHTSTLASKVNADASEKMADFCIRPNCSQYGSTEVSAIDDFIEIGYREAMSVLRDSDIGL